ncbi:fasciclin-like arabinogalactan protein 14 [Lolium rigidum]|uniref:fasciclin-like arabinogalactan protein 14 n=1 Tax=Lolium rigidum TaxID=89674 RepID=UPI001F5C9C24|nr:fasciclin-like arabinogalactan protein 14 [Lolium rigidum]
MAPINASFGAAVLSLLFLVSSTAAFNITRILGEFSDFSTLNSLFSQTKLADEINRRQTITVLAVDNGAMGAISALPSDVQRKVLAVHVVLDYYDADKLRGIKNGSAMLTTMFQSTGQATNRMGFINYTRRADGVMMFGSAEPGASLTSQMVKSVASRPYNISVLQVSSAIVPPSIGSTDGSKAHAPENAHAKAPAPAPTPSTSKKPNAPAPAPAPSDDSSAEGPADAPGPAADGPDADGPVADSPDADGPSADSPDADGPAGADAPADDSDDTAAATGRVVAHAGLGVMALVIMGVSL